MLEKRVQVYYKLGPLEIRPSEGNLNASPFTKLFDRSTLQLAKEGANVVGKVQEMPRGAERKNC